MEDEIGQFCVWRVNDSETVTRIQRTMERAAVSISDGPGTESLLKESGHRKLMVLFYNQDHPGLEGSGDGIPVLPEGLLTYKPGE